MLRIEYARARFTRLSLTCLPLHCNMQSIHHINIIRKIWNDRFYENAPVSCECIYSMNCLLVIVSPWSCLVSTVAVNLTRWVHFEYLAVAKGGNFRTVHVEIIDIHLDSWNGAYTSIWTVSRKKMIGSNQYKNGHRALKIMRLENQYWMFVV